MTQNQKMVDRTRIYKLNEFPEKPGPVIYWMQRDQRSEDNWALLYAREQATLQRQSLAVVFCLMPHFLDATYRQYHFMLKGLRETERKLEAEKIPFFLLTGSPDEILPGFLEKCGAGLLVTDFNPLKHLLKMKSFLAGKLGIAFHEVDAHNIVPCRIASQKSEFGARTLRPKISRILPDYLTVFPDLQPHSFKWNGAVESVRWEDLPGSLRVDFTTRPVVDIIPGADAAANALTSFIKLRAASYSNDRNLPEIEGQSGLSPWLHFGQISAQRVALEILQSGIPSEAKKSFLEELIVRRELSDNFCLYNQEYDCFEGFPAWAKKTLNEHRSDVREFMYSLNEFENAETHDELWNAAQKEMMITGKMHGFMRMYWAKKILEWTSSPEEALAVAIFLNDKYELDGRDPNGYAGIAWSIGGVHDRPWQNRPVFGMIRYMNYNGCLRKFDVKSYIGKIARVSVSQS